MGLDLALGVIILLAAFRGWLKGFVYQAVRIGGFIACFYLADPLRDQARPYILPKMPAINPGLMDQILWWVAAAVSYVLLVGLATLAIQLSRTSPGKATPLSDRREDQIGGLIIGLAKGLLVAASLAAAALNYTADLARNIPWIGHQCHGSFALAWSASYRPIPRLWATAPVRNFVEHITHNGLNWQMPPEVDAVKNVAERGLIEGDPASGLPRLSAERLGELLRESVPGDPARGTDWR
jgi:uncharacterized membrane protein required for colicin V production